MMLSISDVTAVIVNRWTLNLTRQCTESLLRFYPMLYIILVDNKSGDGHPSLRYCEQASVDHDNVSLIRNTRLQPHHGTGLNLGMSHVLTSLLLTVDSDVILQGSGVLEKMVQPFINDSATFATGHVWRGAAADCEGKPRPGEPTTDFVHPFFAMWDIAKFRALHVQFSKTGIPSCHPCRRALDHGYTLHKVDCVHPRCRREDCIVRHLGGGTRARLGKEKKQ